jgi:hypothetical protein
MVAPADPPELIRANPEVSEDCSYFLLAVLTPAPRSRFLIGEFLRSEVVVVILHISSS